jgi:hypothetical protein
MVGGKYGFADTAGREAVRPQYDAVQDFSEGIAGVMLDGKWGFIKLEARD